MRGVGVLFGGMAPDGHAQTSFVQRCHGLCLGSSLLSLATPRRQERMVSPSVPGLETVYTTHEVRMRVSDIARKELTSIGLPGMSSFCTERHGMRQSWRWHVCSETSKEAGVGEASRGPRGVLGSAADRRAPRELLAAEHRANMAPMFARKPS